MKKGSKLPLYALYAVIALALIYAVANPPAPQIPGPVGKFPAWKSTTVVGKMTAQAVNPAGTMWAGAWSDSSKDKAQSAVHIVDLNGFGVKSYALPEGSPVELINWSGGTVRACCGAGDKGLEVSVLDAATGKPKSSDSIGGVKRVLAWPDGSDVLLAESEASPRASASNMVLMVVSAKSGGEAIGKGVEFDLPKDASLAKEAGVVPDGSSFVFSVSDPAANDGKSFYWADTNTGIAKKAFDLADVPGKIEGMWLSKDGILMLCRVRGNSKKGDSMKAVLYSEATGKPVLQKQGADLKRFPGAPKTIAFMTYDGGYEFDLSTGKTRTLFDMRKKTSSEDKGWRDFLRDSRLYKLESGNFVAISETGGLIDIREIKPDGKIGRAMISRN